VDLPHFAMKWWPCFPMAAEVLDDLGGFEQMTFGGYQYALPKCVHNDRVVLLGDAAHAMSPHLGQGANLALVDAECLARHLATRTIPDALSAYRDERRSQTRYFAALSRFLSPFFQSNSAVLALGRDLGLPVLCAVPWIRCQMELSAAGLKQGILDQLWRT
jgi:2-polyprenyl-6-methoxyphenol hydroxylase-like FAD-dependent oxidoreductase